MAALEHNFNSVDALNADFSKQIVDILAAGILANGRASLVVSGGRTPAKLFNQLSQQTIEWDKVDITLADERWVGIEDPASNEAMVHRELLINAAASANFMGLKTDHDDAQAAIETLEKGLESFKTPFDVLILGMGEDGHTASLFPCSDQIEQGLDLSIEDNFIAVTPTTAPNQRMSFTLQRLLKSDNVFLHLVGESKKSVVADALSNSNALEMPIRAMFTGTTVNIMWAP